MKKYCKAYFLHNLRQFTGWTQVNSNDESTLTDNTICYLWDDFTVSRNPLQETTPLFDQVTPEWQNFCIHTLNFAIPEDLQHTYQKN